MIKIRKHSGSTRWPLRDGQLRAFLQAFIPISDEYREFMNENDIEIVQRWGFWVILRKKASDGEFVLYSDVDSQLEHYKKVLRMFQAVTGFEFLILLFEIYGAATTHSVMAWAAVFLIMAIVIVFINAIVNTRNIVSELTERKTGIASDRKSNVSALLMVGMLFNSCALIIGDNIPYGIKLVVQVIAIIFMLSGVYDTARRVKANR